MSRTHFVSLPELPPEPQGDEDDGLRSADVDRRFSMFVRALPGDWQLGDALTASRVVDGIEHTLVLSDEVIHVSVAPVISGSASAACGFVGLINATLCLYIGHDVLQLTSTVGALLTAAMCLVTSVTTWALLTRSMFVWPRRRQLDEALITLDDDVKKRLGTTRGIVTRT